MYRTFGRYVGDISLICLCFHHNIQRLSSLNYSNCRYFQIVGYIFAESTLHKIEIARTFREFSFIFFQTP